MTALAADNITKTKSISRTQYYTVAANAVIYKGAMVMLDAGGDAIPAADAAGGNLRVVGIADEFVDNTGGADEDLKVRVVKCVARVTLSGLTRANMDASVHVADDQTVAASSTNSVIAGRLVELDEDDATKCWIECGL